MSSRPEASLAGAREVWAGRAGARTRGDTAYAVYLVAMTGLVLGVPALRVILEALQRPDVLPLLLAREAPGMVTAGWLLACGALVMVGQARGPAVLTRFFTATLASSALPRWRALLHPFARSLGVLLAVGALAAVIVGGTLLQAGRATPGEAALALVAALGAALLGGGAWLAGELLGDRGRRTLVVVLLGAAGAVALLTTGGHGWPALLGPGSAMPGRGANPATVLCAVILLAAGAGMAGGCVRLLDRLRSPVLLAQAERWESALVAATSGDLGTAAGGFRALPTAGRRWAAVRVPRTPGTLSRGLLYVRRDLVALARTPERALGGVLAVLAGGAALGASGDLTGPVGWALALGGAALMWMGCGTWVDGLRQGIATLGAPPLLGDGVARQTLWHAVSPLLLCGALGALGGLLSGGAAGACLALLLAPLLVLGRVRDSAKGPMPLRVSMPMPTPQGDVSVFAMLGWQADALLIVLACAGLLRLGSGADLAGAAGSAAPLWGAGAAALPLVTIVAGALLALNARRRIRDLQGDAQQRRQRRAEG